jgi:hypothetical protein
MHQGANLNSFQSQKKEKRTMKKQRQSVLLVLIALVALLPTLGSPAGTALADGDGYIRIDGEIRGYPYTLLRPDDWNGDLVLLVHGSVPWWFEIFGPILADQGFGVGYATFSEETGAGQMSSYKEMLSLTRFVQAQYTAQFGAPDRTYLYAFSRGANHSIKLLETSPTRYDGVLSACGPNAGMPVHNQYRISARALFDYFYPVLIPGTPLESPVNSLTEFFEQIAPLIVQAIVNNDEPAKEMARTNIFNFEYSDQEELIDYIVDSQMILMSTVNDTIAELGGSPFDNSSVVYTGSDDDKALNAGVARFSGDKRALKYLEVWGATTGDLGETPFLSLHTSKDGTVPEKLHNDIFQALVDSTGSGDYYVRRVSDRLGHCNFTIQELLGGLNDLVHWVETGEKPAP